jgi:hypothetical protein
MGRSELDPRLEALTTKSPELAAVLAGKHHDPSSRYRRLAILVGSGAVAIGLLWFATASRLPGGRSERASEPAQEIDSSHYLSPIKTVAAGPGEETAPFSGFAVSVETEPPGALVQIRGVPRGEAPVLANLDCRGNDRIEIRAEKKGFRAARQEIACREDTLVKLLLRLSE